MPGGEHRSHGASHRITIRELGCPLFGCSRNLAPPANGSFPMWHCAPLWPPSRARWVGLVQRPVDSLRASTPLARSHSTLLAGMIT